MQIGTHPPITAAQIGLRIRLNIIQCVATLKATIYFIMLNTFCVFSCGFSILFCPATHARTHIYNPSFLSPDTYSAAHNSYATTVLKRVKAHLTLA